MASAGQLRGPQPPVLRFDPSGNVKVLEDVEAMRGEYASQRIPWPFTKEPQP